MPTKDIVCLALLLASLIVTYLLGRARALGPLTVAGFALGALSTGSAFVLFG